jgi:DNA-binding protein H-NS
MDLNTLTTPELKQLRKDVEVALIAREALDKKEAIAKVHAVAAEVNMPVAELVAMLGGKAKKDRATVPMKYYNPADNSQQWTGRGRAPVWAQALKDKGLLDTALPARTNEQEPKA